MDTINTMKINKKKSYQKFETRHNKHQKLKLGHRN